MKAATDTTREILHVRPEGIPGELKVRRQWVTWRLEERGGKLTKVPYTPGTSHKASSTDLLTWRSFEDALDGLDRCDGIGFAFCSGDPFTGVDLDDCRDLETGEVEPWAAKIVADLGSYTELSPSGTGLHIIAKGEILSNGKRGRVEMYSMKRFFTMTGHSLSGER